MNQIGIGILLGIVEGITEFLPVSSTGHLIVVGDLIGFSGPTAKTFDVFIQLGAILAVVVLYWRRFLGFIPGSRFAVGPFSGGRAVALIAVACVPVFVVGGVWRETIRSLFHPLVVAAALAVGGAALVGIESFIRNTGRDSLDSITPRDAVIVGFFQLLSLWPGMSRSAATIVGGMVAGVSRRVAAEFSFFVAVPVMFAASTLDLVKASHLSMADLPLFASGFVTSFVVAVLAIRTFISVLGRWTFRPFGVYRLVVAALIWWWYRG